MLKLQVLNGNPYNRKCDVYSFGICVWEIYCCDMPYPDLSFSEVTSAVVRQVNSPTSQHFLDISNHILSRQIDQRRIYTSWFFISYTLFVTLFNCGFCCATQNLRPDIPRCCPSSLANVMKRCWDANPDKRPEMDEVVSMIEAIDTSKGGGMIPVDQQQGCFCFRRHRGP